MHVGVCRWLTGSRPTRRGWSQGRCHKSSSLTNSAALDQHIVARTIKEHPDIVVNDWIPDDRTDGGLQFDNGLCGRALISAWELTKDARYLDAARKSGDWAMSRPLVENWNYNAFSVGLLARLATVTGETSR
jgi:rhamnogalacturonyl hydrolase YesR